MEKIDTKVFSLKNGKKIVCEFKRAARVLKISEDKSIYLFGDIFYHIASSGAVRFIDGKSDNYLKKLFVAYVPEKIIPVLEGQYVGFLVDSAKKNVTVFSDRYARLDSFYTEVAGDFYFSSDLDSIFEHTRPVYDQKMLANLFAVYGWYTPRGLTIYKNVKRLKVGEILTFDGNGAKSKEIAFKPLEIEELGEKGLETYYKFLRESILARANKDGINWISSSSGWDSSTILGVLVSELGNKNVRMLSGSMHYSKDTATINEFEINKIKNIGKFYGIKPQIVDLNFKDASARSYWEKILPSYRSRHTYAFSTFNFSKLSDGLSAAAKDGQVIFNGETSDSFHNFGFSQFATFFHTAKSFTEYGDKMNCYLYGPSFFKKVVNDTYKKDKVYQIFSKMLSGTEFIDAPKERAELVQAYLYPLFYGSPRVPFAKTQQNPIFTSKGVGMVYGFPFKEYMPQVLDGLNEKNLYSWFIYLYQNFHSQGSTVAMHKHSMEFNKHNWRAPFNDYRLIELLSKAPESWGRGLDFNHTKYPLKWVAQNKIKFPYELLQEGPHSYLYDVIEGFSLMAEIVYRSGVTSMFKDLLKDKPYRKILSDEYFDLDYLDRLASDFLAGKQTSGADLNNLVSLLTFVATGWY